MVRYCIVLAAALGTCSLISVRSSGGDKELPRVVLIGDSIRLGYAPLVAKKLAGKAVIVSVKDNGGDSANVLKHLEDWVIKEKPALVHLNCGLHDLKLSKKDKKHQVEPDQYEANLRAIVGRIKKVPNVVLIVASTTPILDERHAKRKANFDRLEADVKKYNEVSARVMKELGIPVNDLHGVVVRGGPEKLLGGDGTHYTAEGNERLAEAVADVIVKHLTASKGR